MNISNFSTSLMNGVGISLGGLELATDFLYGNPDYYEPELTEVKATLSNKPSLNSTKRRKNLKPKITKEALLNKYSLVQSDRAQAIHSDDVIDEDDIVTYDEDDFSFDFDDDALDMIESDSTMTEDAPPEVLSEPEEFEDEQSEEANLQLLATLQFMNDNNDEDDSEYDTDEDEEFLDDEDDDLEDLEDELFGDDEDEDSDFEDFEDDTDEDEDDFSDEDFEDEDDDSDEVNDNDTIINESNTETVQKVEEDTPVRDLNQFIESPQPYIEDDDELEIDDDLENEDNDEDDFLDNLDEDDEELEEDLDDEDEEDDDNEDEDIDEDDSEEDDEDDEELEDELFGDDEDEDELESELFLFSTCPGIYRNCFVSKFLPIKRTPLHVCCSSIVFDCCDEFRGYS